jgi:hypothetical protein
VKAAALTVLGCLALAPCGALPTGSLATPVRVVVVANFENGADAGDKPGEYQFWVNVNTWTKP